MGKGNGTKKLTVCVIGLGPAGLPAMKELKEAGFKVVGYDTLNNVGGRWAQDESYDSGVWKELIKVRISLLTL